MLAPTSITNALLATRTNPDARQICTTMFKSTNANRSTMCSLVLESIGQHRSQQVQHQSRLLPHCQSIVSSWPMAITKIHKRTAVTSITAAPPAIRSRGRVLTALSSILIEISAIPSPTSVRALARLDHRLLLAHRPRKRQGLYIHSIVPNNLTAIIHLASACKNFGRALVD